MFGSLLAFSCYEWLVRHASSQLTGTCAFVNPVVAVLLGWWLLGEHVSGRTVVAAAIIVTGVVHGHARAPWFPVFISRGHA